VFRHKQELGEDAWTATLRGASEVVLPIAASTLTTMCVFLPMVFMQSGGRFAGFMQNIGLTVVVVMAASFIVAVTVVPMVAARLLKKERSRSHPFFDRVSTYYGRSLRFMLRHRLAFATLTVVVLVWSWNLYQGIGRTQMAHSFERFLRINVDVPKSYSVEQKRDLYDAVYAMLDERREELDIANITHSFRRSAGRSRGWGGGNRFDIYLLDEEQATRDTAEIRDEIESMLPQHPGIKFTLGRSMRGHGSSGSGIEMVLKGDRMEILEVLSARIVNALRAVPGLKDVDSSLESGDEEVHVRPDAERVLQAGLTTRAVGQSISSALSSRPVSYFEVEDRELNIVVQHREKDRRTLEQLRKMPLAFGNSKLPIGALAEFESAPGARAISRENRSASLTITADTASDVPSFMAQGLAQRAVAGVEMPSGYSVGEGQSWRWGNEDASDALFMLGFALVLVYMVMASLFESFAQPFTIMFSVPFAFIGVGVIMKIAGQPRSSTADIGLIILAGIVVNNAIVMVDHINRLRKSGLTRDEASVLGGRHRLRPILMTAMTTILGLSPMVAPFFLPQVFGAVDGRAAFWAPVGLVVLGGLTTSTLLTVMVIPVVYSLVDDLTRFTSRIARAVT
jgi:HAE1 family hydrophobic/amphiphilic exporter-1